jgi:signal transduction histidine kinase
VELDKLRGTISSNLSHERRTPFKIILSTLELILKQKFVTDEVELKNYINSTTDSAYRLNFLVDDLEMLYEMDQMNLTFMAEKIDNTFHLKNSIGKTLNLWEKKRLNTRLTIDREAIIYAPRDRFSHIIAHLVDNACKFSPKNGEITISVKPNAEGGCFFEVVNEGSVIPVELREKVFERYFQISQGDIQEFEGLGVGLTIARAYARAWGGDVQVLDCSTGCRVRMVLPPQKKWISNMLVERKNARHTSH